MKKFLMLSLIGFMGFATSAMAGNSSGCGLGSLVWEGQSGMVPNILASTTNGTSNSQTFGITFGTSNCNASDTVQLQRQKEVFVADNHGMIYEQMAMGQGEYLVAYSQVMGCNAAGAARFGQVTQSKAAFIFSNAADSSVVLDRTRQVINQDAQLKDNCQLM